MFDSYPIYGPFGYSSANDTSSGIRRMTSGYSLRNISTRTTLPDGSTASVAGPNVNSSYPIGSFLWDYEWLSTNGDLDVSNGRWCVTPEYPDGTYAYFTSTDSTGAATYPFTIGSNYYGSVPVTGNTVTSISASATTYF